MHPCHPNIVKEFFAPKCFIILFKHGTIFLKKQINKSGLTRALAHTEEEDGQAVMRPGHHSHHHSQSSR